MCSAKTVTCQNFSAFWIKFLGYQKRSKSWNVYLIKKLCYQVFSKLNCFSFFFRFSFKEMVNEASFQLWQNGNVSKKLTFVSLEGKNVWYCAKYGHNVANAFIFSHLITFLYLHIEQKNTVKSRVVDYSILNSFGFWQKTSIFPFINRLKMCY